MAEAFVEARRRGTPPAYFFDKSRSIVGGLFARLSAPARRAWAVLFCLGVVAAGYAVAHWTMGERPPAAAAGLAAQVPVEDPGAGSLSEGDVFRSSVPAESDPVPPGDRRQSGFAADLVLTGVASSGRVSFAIIADAGGRQSVYRIGDQIRAGVTLVEVSRNGAVVARGDVRERLPLARSAAAQDLPPGEGEAASLLAGSGPTEAGSDSGAGRSSPPRRRNFSPEVLRQGAIALDPAGGFQIKKVIPGSLYAKLGLRAGDVLRGVNGTPVDSPEQLMVLYRQLNEGGQGKVEVLREGRPEALHYGGK